MTSDGAEISSAREEASQLCLSCGLCCGGTFFGFVELQPGEDTAGLSALLPLERRAGKMIFRLPCPALRGACCQIYNQRPHICRAYRCKVLRRVEESPSELTAALEKVSVLVASFAALKEQLQQSRLIKTDADVPAAIKAFRTTYTTALNAGEAAFFERHRELILRWKKTAWLMQVFDQKAAARLALPWRKAASAGAKPEVTRATLE